MLMQTAIGPKKKFFETVIDGERKLLFSIRGSDNGDVMIIPNGLNNITQRLTEDEFIESFGNDPVDKITAITVHPNLSSPYDTISVHYKDEEKGNPSTKQYASGHENKRGSLFFPVLICLGVTPEDNFSLKPFGGVNGSQYDIASLFPEGISSDSETLGYCVLVSNRFEKHGYQKTQYTYLRWIYLPFDNFLITIVFWLLPSPSYGVASIGWFPAHKKIGTIGMKHNEVLDFIDEITLEHLAGLTD